MMRLTEPVIENGMGTGDGRAEQVHFIFRDKEQRIGSIQKGSASVQCIWVSSGAPTPRRASCRAPSASDSPRSDHVPAVVGIGSLSADRSLPPTRNFLDGKKRTKCSGKSMREQWKLHDWLRRIRVLLSLKRIDVRLAYFYITTWVKAQRKNRILILHVISAEIPLRKSVTRRRIINPWTRNR